jgi:hypothetical protein
MNNKVIATLTRIDDDIYSPSEKSKNEPSDIIKNLPSEVSIKQGHYILGRGKDADVMMSIRVNKKEVISRAHAEIICSNNAILFVKDLNSVNGVFVNGLRIDNQMLYDEDIIQIGGMSKIPTGKKLKQSAENVQYRFQYKQKVPDVLRFSAPGRSPTPSSSSSAGRKSSARTVDSHSVKATDPFKSGTKAMQGSGVVSATIFPDAMTGIAAASSVTERGRAERGRSQASVPAASAKKGKGQPQDYVKPPSGKGTPVLSPNKRQRAQFQEREQEPGDRERGRDRDSGLVGDLQGQGKRRRGLQEQVQQEQQEQQRCEELQTAQQKLRSELRSKEDLLQQQAVRFKQQVARKESDWMERIHCLEKEQEEAKCGHELEQQQLIAENKEELARKDATNFEIISNLKQTHAAENSLITSRLQAALDQAAATGKKESDWVKRVDIMESELQESKHELEQKSLLIASCEKLLQTKDEELLQMKTSHDQLLLSRDEVWAEKLNGLLETSSEDTRAFKAQLRQLQQRHLLDREELNSSQEKIASLQAAAARATTSSSSSSSSAPAAASLSPRTGGGAAAAAGVALTASSPPPASLSALAEGSCSIGADALRELLMCALCQQPMLDAVVCRCVPLGGRGSVEERRRLD